MKTKKLNENIRNTIEFLLCNFEYAYYGEFAGYIKFIESNDLSTMGVNIDRKGMNFYYNSEFVNKLPREQMNWGFAHELLHLLMGHVDRLNGRDHHLSNIAQDMIINHILDTKFDSSKFKRIPNTLTISKEYLKLVEEGKKKLYYEELYNWLLDKKEEYEQEKKEHGQQGQGQQGQGQQGQGQQEQGQQGQGQQGQGQQGQGQQEQGQQEQGNGQGNGQNRPDANGKYPDGTTSKVPKDLRDVFDSLDESGNYKNKFDEHLENEEGLDNEIAKEIVNQVKSTLKNKGLENRNIEYVLDTLSIKKKKDYLKPIKRAVDALKGSSIQTSINKPSRIGVEGIKGVKRYGKGLNVLLDTSGSMGSEFERVLGYIFQKNIIVNLIQCDTAVKGFDRIDKLSDFKKIQIKGLGGTVLQPGIDYTINNKKLHGFNLCILTDGYTDSLDLSGLKCKKVLIISTGTEAPIKNKGSVQVRQIVIDKEE